MEVHKTGVEGSVSLDPPVVLGFDVAEKEGVTSVQRALEQLGSEVICGTEPVLGADDDGEDSFVDVVGGGKRDEVAVSEGFTCADALKRAKLVSETILERDVGSSELRLC